MPVVASPRKLVMTTRCRFRSKARKRRTYTGPSSACSLIRARRYWSEPQEAGDDDQVQVSIEGAEAPHVHRAFQRVLPDQSAPVLERARQPQGGVRAGDDKRTDQQRRHAPEGIEQDRIADRVVVGGMRQIAGELPMRTGMAPRAGLDDVTAAEPRPGVCNRQDVVSPVAIVALGCLEITQLGHLAVVRFEIARRDGLVALPALIHNVQAEIRLVRALDAVRRMAVVAHGQWL